jgi:hypothetical protein
MRHPYDLPARGAAVRVSPPRALVRPDRQWQQQPHTGTITFFCTILHTGTQTTFCTCFGTQTV